MVPGLSAEDIHIESPYASVSISRETAEVIMRGKTPPKVRVPRDGLRYEAGSAWHRVVRIVGGGFLESEGRLLAIDEEGSPVALKVTFPAEGVARLSIVPSRHFVTRVEMDLESHPDDHFYGMGEPWNETLDQRGQKVRMWVKTGTPDQCCFVPFFMSSRGYGLFVDDYHDGIFDFCAEDAERVRITFLSPRLDFCFIAGPGMKTILTRYCAITGFPPLPPVWSFLPWKWRNETDRRGVMEDAENMRALDIPLGVMMIDRPWAMGPYGNNDFEFDPERYPDAEVMIKALNDMGTEVVVWVCDFNRSDAGNFDEGLKVAAYCDGPGEEVAKDPDQVGSYHLDFRNPKGYAFWKREMQKVIRLGVAGFKLDRGQSIGDEARFANGESGREMHNYHGYLFNRCCYEALRELRGDDFTMLPRAGWAGSQQFAVAKWPGDMNASFDNHSGLPAVVLSQQAIGLSGFPFYGSDIGGFARETSVPVFARWVEHGALSPVMQCPHQPWEYGDEMVRIYRKYAKLHTELVPYIYHHARGAHETGIPITRPLMLEYPDDPKVVNLWSEYMFGDSILVAPVITEENRRDIYLPRGTWYDYWSRESHEGPVTLPPREIPLDHLPMFVKAGSVIPMAVEDDATGRGGEFSKGALTLDIYPKPVPLPALEAEPAREFGWPRQIHRLPEYTITTLALGDLVHCSGAPGKVVFRIQTKEPQGVLHNGAELRRGAEEGCWFYAGDSGRLYVIVSANQAHQVLVKLP